MSFRPPRCVRATARRAKDVSQSSQPSPHHIIPVQDAPRSRLAQGTSHLQLPRVQSLFVMPGNRNYTQLPTGGGRRQSPGSQNDQDEYHPPPDAPPYFVTLAQEQDTSIKSERARQKREKQYNTWAYTVIPSLLKPYMRLLRETDSLRDMNGSKGGSGCTCNGSHARKLSVICVYFERKAFCIIDCLQIAQRTTYRTGDDQVGYLRMFICSSPAAQPWAFCLRSCSSYLGRGHART